MKKKSLTQYPASYQLALKQESFVQTDKKVQRAEISIGINIRVVNTERHWKPISKILKAT